VLKVHNNQLKWLPALSQLPKLKLLLVRRFGAFDLAR
jgi:hypothetical protein